MRSGESVYTSADACWLQLDYCSAKRFYRGHAFTDDCFVVSPDCQCYNYVLDSVSVTGVGVTVAGTRAPSIRLAPGALAKVTLSLALVADRRELSPGYRAALRHMHTASLLKTSLSFSAYAARKADSVCQSGVQRPFPLTPGNFTFTISRREDTRLAKPEDIAYYTSIGLVLVLLCLLFAFVFVQGAVAYRAKRK